MSVLGLAALWLVLAADAFAEREKRPVSTVTTEIRPAVTRSAGADTFDWLDAAIGGAAVLGLLLVTAGTATVVLRRPQKRVLFDIHTSRKEPDR